MMERNSGCPWYVLPVVACTRYGRVDSVHSPTVVKSSNGTGFQIPSMSLSGQKSNPELNLMCRDSCI